MTNDIHFPNAADNLIYAILEDGGVVPICFDLKRLCQNAAPLPIKDW